MFSICNILCTKLLEYLHTFSFCHYFVLSAPWIRFGRLCLNKRVTMFCDKMGKIGSECWKKSTGKHLPCAFCNITQEKQKQKRNYEEIEHRDEAKKKRRAGRIFPQEEEINKEPLSDDVNSNGRLFLCMSTWLNIPRLEGLNRNGKDRRYFQISAFSVQNY